MNRRHFLRASSVIGLPFLASPLSANMTQWLQQLVDPQSDRVLVLVQLSGGNDGLNTLIPLDQYATLMGVRTNLMIPENRLLSLTDTQALHPAMTGLQQLFQEGMMGAIQGVGYPNQNRSHFRSTDIWTSGSSAEEVITAGWLGRHFMTDHAAFPEGYPNEDYPAPFAIAIGSQVSQTCQGVGVNYSMALTDPFNVTAIAVGGDTPLPNTPYGDELGFLRSSIAQTNAYGGLIQSTAEQGSSLVEYPDSQLAAALKNVAYLISGGLPTKVYIVNQGGYDTHANQVDLGDTAQGEHAALLADLSASLLAFHQDLQAQGLEDRVLSMTFSEFGRRIRSNAALGSDHGSAAPLFLLGSCVQAGILGTSPEIDPAVDAQEGVAMQYDFRDVYGSVLQDWFSLSPTDVRSVLGHDYIHLPIIRPCGEPSRNEEQLLDLQAEVYPNPFAQTLVVSFQSAGGPTDLSVFDLMGRRVEQIFQRSLSSGSHQFTLQLGHLPSATYILRVQSGVSVRTQRLVKR